MVDFEMKGDLVIREAGKIRRTRINQDIKLMIEWLIKTFPNLYESQSHLQRCAIIELFNKKKQEVEKLAEQRN
jgi:hypothetical protein